MGTAAPTGASWGIRTFTCVAPAIRPGAWPTNVSSALTEPIVALTPANGVGKGATSGPTAPSAMAGFSEPVPVIYTETMEPRGAGFEGEFTVGSWFRIAAWPLPLAFVVKMPGTEATTGSFTGPSVWPPAWTATSVDRPGVTSNGTTALIWQLDVYRTGAANGPKLTDGLDDPKPLP